MFVVFSESEDGIMVFSVIVAMSADFEMTLRVDTDAGTDKNGNCDCLHEKSEKGNALA